ncbi:maleylpyruvate isomerase family mycothiol-dependent enzyme [Streptomyces sp. 549]|uniref:maleylpyruvate isomerase family mycothiol-dependent enzyme n=1 Tax=Streptomyces sp. 549 TaxID=3049076 RepID=UPI0024C3131E|nr:maleylpyruvate isomerase family mycothiol-dependent enzyme [Streptomyces sp. 549]MDK1472187.1 maleylpyruvate isomerase family mycothiol-dependent enzyme [Streptomyces sp. 549]
MSGTLTGEERWRAVDRERLSLAGLLDTLSPAEWELPTQCDGWRVRDVAAHLTLAPRIGLGRILREIVRARGDFDRMIHDTACQAATRPTEVIAADLRALAGWHRPVLGTTRRESLLDILVHGQDIALAVGRERPMPVDAACDAADRVYRMSYPFQVRRRLGGRRLTATDVAWDRGEGPEIRGPIAALLLLLTGREQAARPHLHGPGLSTSVDPQSRTAP